MPACVCVCVSGGLGHSDSDHMWMQLCVFGLRRGMFLRAECVCISTTLQESRSQIVRVCVRSFKQEVCFPVSVHLKPFPHVSCFY